MERQKYKFKIDSFTPDTLPMKRLAEYMNELATLFGSQERVHFVGIEAGSAVVIQEVEYESIPKVKERLAGIRDRSAPSDAIEAYLRIDGMLAYDNAGGVIEANYKTETAKVIEFPGKNRDVLEVYGPVNQSGSVDGILIRIGGTDETVPVLLLEEEKKRHYCTCSREIAKKLAPHLFGGVLRAHGNGRWRRDDFGNWVMERFSIHDFEILDESKLSDVVSKLRAIPSDLQTLDDPLGALRRIRRGDTIQ